MNLRHTLAAAAVLFTAGISQADDVASAALAEVTSQKTKTFDVADARFRGPTNFKIRYPASWGTSEFGAPRRGHAFLFFLPATDPG